MGLWAMKDESLSSSVFSCSNVSECVRGFQGVVSSVSCVSWLFESRQSLFALSTLSTLPTGILRSLTTGSLCQEEVGTLVCFDDKNKF